MAASGFAQIAPVVVIAPRALTLGTPVVSGILDMQGYESVEFLATGGDWLSGALATISIQHGEQPNLSDATVATGNYLYRSEDDAEIGAADTVGRVGYRIATGKRYVRVTVTPTGNGASEFTPVVQRVLDPVYWDVRSGPIFSEIVDTDGFAFADFQLAQGSGTGAKWTASMKLQHGDLSNGSDMADATTPVVDSNSQQFSYVTNRVKRIGYKTGATGAKRYVRASITVTPGTDPGTAYLCVTSELVNLPDASPGYGLVALFQTVRTPEGAL